MLFGAFFFLLFYFSDLLKNSRIMSEKIALNNLFWNGPKFYARSGPLRSEMWPSSNVLCFTDVKTYFGEVAEYQIGFSSLWQDLSKSYI